MIRMKRLIAVTSFFLLAACSQNQQANESQLALMKTTNPSPVVTKQNSNHDRVKKIEKEVSDINEIYDVAVVEGNKETLVVYKVKHMQRFRMKKIEKDLNKMLEERFPKEDFVVSSDYKIFLEVIRLNERMEKGNVSDRKAEKRLNELVKMTTDMK
ncbi:YhcN/YlaJ family sporulation lipoprotein [Neobacillus sp. FSL H8-0543]|uniref:YhcN/YlaJ family sporulation lipoprotein n=1 Tax=Neobacillus sp. FSL H8-0543 TaxID=2954672 RepID=UPI0031584A7A